MLRILTMEIQTKCITKLTFSIVLIVTFVHSKEKIKTKEELELDEDILILQQSIEKYGPPQSYEKYKLPGPDVKVGNDKMLEENSLRGNSKNFTYRLRTISEDYAFIEHYETTEVRILNKKAVSMIRGQVSEEIPRKNGGFYLRTIGYIFDENGFQDFLIDITKIEKVEIKSQNMPSLSVAPEDDFAQPQISQSVLSSLGGAVLG